MQKTYAERTLRTTMSALSSNIPSFRSILPYGKYICCVFLDKIFALNELLYLFCTHNYKNTE